MIRKIKLEDEEVERIRSILIGENDSIEERFGRSDVLLTKIIKKLNKHCLNFNL